MNNNNFEAIEIISIDDNKEIETLQDIKLLLIKILKKKNLLYH